MTETTYRTCAERVYTELGPGHSESVYQRAMCVALWQADVWSDQEVVLPVYFSGHPVGHVRLDILTETHVLELKALVSDIKDPGGHIQVKRYRRILGDERRNYVLINFGGKSLQIFFYE